MLEKFQHLVVHVVLIGHCQDFLLGQKFLRCHDGIFEKTMEPAAGGYGTHSVKTRELQAAGRQPFQVRNAVPARAFRGLPQTPRFFKGADNSTLQPFSAKNQRETNLFL